MTAQFLLVCAALLGQAAAETSGNDGLKWQNDLAAAQREARQSGRLVLIHFGGPWCEPCRRLEQQVFRQPGFGRDLATRYVAVKIDPRQQHQLAEKYGVRAVPCDVVTTPPGQLVVRLESPTSAAAYSETLNRVADNVLPPAPRAMLATTAPGEAATEPSAEPEVAQQGTPDRYADYYNRRRPVPPPASNTAPPAANVAPPAANTAPPAAKIAATEANRTSPPQLPPPAVAESPRQAQATASKNPPFALDRYCPVTLVERRHWQRGNEQWGAIHHGRTYLFVSAAAQKAFLANPDRYSPVFAGNDPVIRVEYHQDVPGKREHGAFYNDHIYLFTSEDTFLRFDRDPARYTAELARPVQRR